MSKTIIEPIKTEALGIQPDIGYYPDWDIYQRRTQRRQQTEILSKTLPIGFPQRLNGSAAWDKSVLTDSAKWLVCLSTDEITEIIEAKTNFKKLNIPLGSINRINFLLPTLGEKLRACSYEVHHGLGFVYLRGFPVDSLCPEDQMIAFMGVSSYIGNRRARVDQSGAAVTHILDLTKSHEMIGNPAFTDGHQALHTDPGDVIGMFALATAAQGGESILSSTSTLYNSLATRRPDLIETLSQDWDADGCGGNPSFIRRPLLYRTENGQIILHFIRRHFTGFREVPRTASIPPISEAQAEALDAVHFVGMENAVQIKFEKGDFQFVNNLNVLHARNSFIDDENSKRHKLRVWLRDDEYGWKDIPSKLTESIAWKRLFDFPMESHSFPLTPKVKAEKFIGP